MHGNKHAIYPTTAASAVFKVSFLPRDFGPWGCHLHRMHDEYPVFSDLVHRFFCFSFFALEQADFETKQPLGVVLERSKEWAIVKLANPELSQVSVGSALASVNGEEGHVTRDTFAAHGARAWSDFKHARTGSRALGLGVPRVVVAFPVYEQRVVSDKCIASWQPITVVGQQLVPKTGQVTPAMFPFHPPVKGLPTTCVYMSTSPLQCFPHYTGLPTTACVYMSASPAISSALCVRVRQQQVSQWY